MARGLVADAGQGRAVGLLLVEDGRVHSGDVADVVVLIAVVVQEKRPAHVAVGDLLVLLQDAQSQVDIVVDVEDATLVDAQFVLPYRVAHLHQAERAGRGDRRRIEGAFHLDHRQDQVGAEAVAPGLLIGDVDDVRKFGEFFLKGGVFVFQLGDAFVFFLVGQPFLVQLQQVLLGSAQAELQEAHVGQAALVVAVGLDHLRQQRAEGQDGQHRQHDSEPFHWFFFEHGSPA